MEIIVLDGYAMNPGDLSWDGLKALGNLTVYERSSVPESLLRVGDAEAILTNKALVPREVMDAAPRLRYIGVMATGYNVVDLEAAAEKGIVVTHVPAYSTASVAQLAFAFILELANRTAQHAESVRAGDWVKSPDFSYLAGPLVELKDKTLGVVGLGQIGRQTAVIGQAFGMKVLASHTHPERDAMEGVTFTDIDTLFSTSDFVSLHCPLKDSNRHFVNRGLIAKMKPSAFLINTSRGPLIAEQDLADALHAGQIAGAALDVLEIEPPHSDNPLLEAPHCLITPHIGWATREARTRLMDTLTGNLEAFLSGAPVHVVR